MSSEFGNKKTTIIRNIEQLDSITKALVIEIKDRYRDLYGYVPKLGECLYVIESGITEPPLCKRVGCSNRGKIFNGRGPYRYCSKHCSDICPDRNKKIQTSRDGKIDYQEVSKKTALTKSTTLVDGKNIHQLTGEKVRAHYVNNPQARIDHSELKKEHCAKVSDAEWTDRSNKRISTMIARHGHGHAGGGRSTIKHVTIFGNDYAVQGYEDVFIYTMIESGTSPSDIVAINRSRDHAFVYEFDGKIRTYYPDFYDVATDTYYEIKSPYWWEFELTKNIAKIAAVESAGKQIKVLIYDAKFVKDVRSRIDRLSESSSIPD